MKKIVLLGILFLFCSLVSAVENMELIDAENGAKLGDLVAHIDIVDDGNKNGVKGMFFVENGILKFPEGEYVGEIILDDSSTASVDYYFYGKFNTADGSISFMPVGKISGSIYDSLNNLISKADINFECDKMSNIAFPKKSDKYGDFVSYIPTGKCVLSVADGSMVGKISFEVKKGESKDIDVFLEMGINSGVGIYWVLFIVLIVVIVIYLLKFKKVKKKPKKKNRNLNSILKTLNDKEKNIVEYLLSNKNISTSSKIRYNLKIPKTSLSRILDKLEEKKILDIEREGNLKKVRISEWILKK
jgi:uncharacterized membrane protein